MDRVGVRELRQSASLLLERAEAGETIEITNRGRPVARLVPIEYTPRTRDELIAQGVLQPARGSVLDVRPVLPTPGSPSTTELLDELRSER